MKRICLALLLTLGFLPATAIAQVTTGTPPFGTFGGGPDVVNIANLNVHLSIPIISKAGRGLPFSYGLSYNSSTYYPVPYNGSAYWAPNNSFSWGWGSWDSPVIGNVSYSITATNSCYNYQQYPPVKTGSYEYLGHWVYYDQTGTPHSFNTGTMILWTSGTCPSGPAQNLAISGSTSDGSGDLLSATGSSSGVASWTVTEGNGTVINLNYSTNETVTDRNGNQISTGLGTGGNMVFTDTLGQQVLTTPTSLPPNPAIYTYTGPSGNVSYTMKYTSQTVRTNFGCSGISEFGPTSEKLVSEIDLPDINSVPNDKYTFTYEATPSYPGDVTGRIASITLPTGGTISYSYSGGSNGITCADGSAATLKRYTPDTGSNYWTYAHSESGTASTTTVTDPQGNETVYSFQGGYQTEQQVYSGLSTLLETVFTCYNGATPNCNNTTVILPIASQATYVQWPSGLESETVMDYNTTSGLPTEKDEYDYGTGSPGSLLRKTLTTYASLGNNIVAAPYQVTVENGSGGTVAQTTYQYDQTAVATTSGTPQHISVSGSRGNATTISYLVQSSTSLSKIFTYFDTGNVDVATDVNGAQTTYNYANATSTCGNTFPTSVSEPLSLSRSMTWNCTGGVGTSVTDENTNTASTTYSDSYFWRPASLKDQEQNTTNYTYTNTNPNSIESSLLFNGGSSTQDALATLDGLGRTLVTQRKQSPGSSSYDSVETNYDSLGRPYQTTVPYSGTAGQTNGSAPKTTTTYDALSRPTQTQDGGGGTVSLTYTGNDVLQVAGPAPSGENPKQRQSEYNSIGQLTSVCEITSTLQGNGTCPQNTSATGYLTKYTYDATGHLLTVTQNAQSAQTQTRTLTYDDLGRMTSEANPETGTIHYVYDSDATCGTYNGDLVKKTDAAGNVTCYAYDALHRVTAIDPISGPNYANTPARYFFYDAATVNGQAMQNAKGRLAEARTANCGTCTVITDEGFSYTARGEVSDEYESTPHSGGYYHAAATYWANGVLQNLSAPIYGVSYNVDGEGRVYSAGTQLTSTTYNAASQPTIMIFGSLDSDSFTYDPNTGRMTQYKYTVGATPQSVVSNLTWNANGTLNSLNITDPFNAANTQNCAYTHDDLARIASGNCGSVWSQTFTYDAFGNITKAGTNSFNPGYNYQTNQMSTGASYDANGDVLSDGLHSYAWDAETRPTTIDNVTVTYDALGRMVEQTKAGTSTEIEYSPTGFKLQLLNGQSSYIKQFEPMPGGAAEVWQSNGPDYYRHADWLGGSRFASTTSRTVYNDLAFAPFGEPYAQSGSAGVTDTSFAGDNEDTVPNLYDAQFREYGIQGRWPSPDPAGIASANPANPQSWNRYAYVLNNPLNSIDPLGLKCVYADNGTPMDDGTGGGCPAAGVGADGSETSQYVYVYDGGGDTQAQADAQLADLEASDPAMTGPVFGFGGFSSQLPFSGPGGAPILSNPLIPNTQSNQQSCSQDAQDLQALGSGMVALHIVLEPAFNADINLLMAGTGAVVTVVPWIPVPEIGPLNFVYIPFGAIPTSAGGLFLLHFSGTFFKNVTWPSVVNYPANVKRELNALPKPCKVSSPSGGG